MKCSIAIPAYKRAFLNEAIDSCLAQTYQNFELIIVNDASPEDLDAIVNSYSDDRICYYKNETNIGGKDPVANWNKCLSLAQGDFFALLCDDDVYEPTFLEELYDLSKKYPDCNVFRAGAKRIDKEGRTVGFYPTCPEWESGIEYLIHLSAGWRFQTISEFLYRRKPFMEVGGYYPLPMAWGADHLSVIRAGLNGGIASTPHKLLSFRTSGINISGAHNQFIREKVKANTAYTKWVYDIASQQDDEICQMIKRYRGRIERIEKTGYLVNSKWRDFFFLLRNRHREAYRIETRCFLTALGRKLKNVVKKFLRQKD